MDGSNPYAEKPWLALYGAGQPPVIAAEYDDALSLFRAAVARAPAEPALLFFDSAQSYAELDIASNAFAAALADRGFVRGDRLAIYLQNHPAFVVALLGAWKAGGIVVPVNPMNRQRELAALLSDCRPAALVCHDDLFEEVVSRLDPAGRSALPEAMYVVPPRAGQSRHDDRVFGAARTCRCDGAQDFLRVVADYAGKRPPEQPPLAADEPAFLVYTSGTTGPPKGAMNTHANICFNAQAYRDWMGLEDGTGVLGIAPLFHITGLVAHVMTAFITASPLVLTYRFEPAVMLAAAREHRPGFTVAAVTALIAMMNHPDATADALASLQTLYSGGAPIPPSTVEQFEQTFGLYIHNIYGLTESSSPTHAVPMGARAPVDPDSGALSIGVPIYNAQVWIADEDGQPAPVGDVGEIVSSGPMIVPGYWDKPDETAQAMRPDGFRTGDVGFMDAQGWFYLVDRKKDQINAGGYKIWPREVEDVLYTHAAVREAGVVGVADEYRGETVKAVVSLKPGADVSPEALQAHCKQAMAAYKYPRIVEIVDELPKTPTGKILRRELRG